MINKKQTTNKNQFDDGTISRVNQQKQGFFVKKNFFVYKIHKTPAWADFKSVAYRCKKYHHHHYRKFVFII